MCAYKTAWSRKASSLPSDRIPPSHSAPRSQGGGGKDGAKGKHKEPDVPKSREVRKLEELRDGLADIAGKERTSRDPKGGCYCQARNHALSPYIPICRHCGLILCEVNQPYHACPHCATSLLAPRAVDSLIASLEQDIDDTLAKEERERERAAEEARKAAGAFPALGPANASSTSLKADSRPHTPPTALDSHPVNQPHKVLSLNSKTKRVTVSSYTKVQPAKASVSKAQAQESHIEPEPVRVPRPPRDVLLPSKAQNPDRPWTNTRGLLVTYVPPPKAKGEASGAGKGKAKKKQGAEGQSSKQEPGKENTGS